MSFVSN